MMYSIFYFFMTVVICIIGALGGIGGGLIIKPVMDFMGQYSLLNIGFLSSCTVLTMTVVSIYKMRRLISDFGVTQILKIAFAAVLGGIFGGHIFSSIKDYFGDDKYVGLTQTAVLLILISGVIVIELRKDKIKHRAYKSTPAVLGIGALLGTISSFLGIGGGPFNKPTLNLLLGMTAKGAAVGSLCIIFFSQFTNVARTLAVYGTEQFDLSVLPYMMAGAVVGGYLGGLIVTKVSEKFYDKLFIGVLVLILMVNFFNFYRYLMIILH